MNYDKWEDQNISFDEWKEIIHNNSDSYMKFYNDESVRIKALDDKNSRKQLSKLIEIMGEMGELQFMEELRHLVM